MLTLSQLGKDRKHILRESPTVKETKLLSRGTIWNMETQTCSEYIVNASRGAGGEGSDRTDRPHATKRCLLRCLLMDRLTCNQRNVVTIASDNY